MIPTLTYPPKFPLPAIGGYRYCFNGQEGDGEAYGQGGLAGYELEYIRYADNKGSLNDNLKAHGWVRTKPKSPQMIPPAMTDLLATNEQIGLARIWRS